MPPFSPPILTLLLLETSGAAEDWARIPVTFNLAPHYHPIYRLADGSVSIRFRASIRNRKFESIECLEVNPKKVGLAKWFIPNIVNRAILDDQPDSDEGVFEMRMCNCACNPNHPEGYSFWAIK